MWVRGGRGTESVSFDTESFGDFSNVGYHVRDVTLVVWCFAEQFRIIPGDIRNSGALQVHIVDVFSC